MNNLRNNINLIDIYIDPINGNINSIDKFTKLHELHVIQHKMRCNLFNEFSRSIKYHNKPKMLNYYHYSQQSMLVQTDLNAVCTQVASLIFDYSLTESFRASFVSQFRVLVEFWK